MVLIETKTKIIENMGASIKNYAAVLRGEWKMDVYLHPDTISSNAFLPISAPDEEMFFDTVENAISAAIKKHKETNT